MLLSTELRRGHAGVLVYAASIVDFSVITQWYSDKLHFRFASRMEPGKLPLRAVMFHMGRQALGARASLPGTPIAPSTFSLRSVVDSS